jgi:hypothetical protein
MYQRIVWGEMDWRAGRGVKLVFSELIKVNITKQVTLSVGLCSSFVL